MDPSVQARLYNLAWSVGTVLFIVVGSLLVGWLARSIARWRGLSKAEQRKVFWGFLFASPWLLGFLIFVLGPSLASLYYSFTDYRLGRSLEWLGLENYRTLLRGEGAHGRRFVQALYNSFYYALIGVPLQILTALGMAMVLNREVRGIRFFRLIFYLPVILAGGPAILLAWRYMLASNGGFINLSLQRFADSFFLFDWLYRSFIFGVEAFNSFYAGIARGDALGPLVYTLPALVGSLSLLGLLGGWSKEKRTRAWRVAEITGVGLVVVLLAKTLVAERLEPALVYGLGCALSLLALSLNRQRERLTLRPWHVVVLVLFGAGTALAFVGGAWRYGVVTLVAILPLAAALIVRRRHHPILGLGAGLLGLLLLVRLMSQFDGGLGVFARYLVFQPALGQAGTLEALEGYAARSPSALWLWALVALVLGTVARLDNRYERLRRTLVVGAFAGFSLLAAGSLLDGWRFFHAFQVVADSTGGANYHFTLFRNTIGTFPDPNRVPLWTVSELWAKPSLILITVWSSGAGMLIFLAALKGVPSVFYEAAHVDGATRWQSFFRITLPLISPAMFYNVVIGLVAALQTFEAVYLIQNPQTESSLASAAYFLFVRTFRQLEIGQGAAASWILAVVIVLLTAMQFRYSSWVHYEA